MLPQYSKITLPFWAHVHIQGFHPFGMRDQILKFCHIFEGYSVYGVYFINMLCCSWCHVLAYVIKYLQSLAVVGIHLAKVKVLFGSPQWAYILLAVKVKKKMKTIREN
jgi:hypothetical protein